MPSRPPALPPRAVACAGARRTAERAAANLRCRLRSVPGGPLSRDRNPSALPAQPSHMRTAAALRIRIAIRASLRYLGMGWTFAGKMSAGLDFRYPKAGNAGLID